MHAGPQHPEQLLACSLQEHLSTEVFSGNSLHPVKGAFSIRLCRTVCGLVQASFYFPCGCRVCTHVQVSLFSPFSLHSLRTCASGDFFRFCFPACGLEQHCSNDGASP